MLPNNTAVFTSYLFQVSYNVVDTGEETDSLSFGSCCTSGKTRNSNDVACIVLSITVALTIPPKRVIYDK